VACGHDLDLSKLELRVGLVCQLCERHSGKVLPAVWEPVLVTAGPTGAQRKSGACNIHIASPSNVHWIIDEYI
jgi:hypothetical protein